MKFRLVHRAAISSSLAAAGIDEGTLPTSESDGPRVHDHQQLDLRRYEAADLTPLY